MQDLFGLPAHPLVVHGAVVLVPLAALGALACLHPGIRRRFGIVVAVLACVAALFTWMAQESGHELQEQVNETHLTEEHAEMGGWVLPWVTVLAVAMVAMVAFDEVERRSRTSPTAVGSGAGQELGEPREATPSGAASAIPLWQKAVTLGLAATLAVTAVGSTVAVIEVGHSGAKATWDDGAGQVRSP
jgi:uncharacterized membrane protein